MQNDMGGGALEQAGLMGADPSVYCGEPHQPSFQPCRLVAGDTKS